MDIVAILSLAAVFSAMFALGAGIHPRRLFRELARFGLLARALCVALIAVPLVAIGAATLFGLERAPLAGLLLIGISPGAPMALRRSRESGGHAQFSMVLQVAVALLAIVAVPAWVLILDALYSARADISLEVLARQVFLAQLLPIGGGAICAAVFPTVAARLVGPMLRMSGVGLLIVAALLLWQFGPLLPALGAAPIAASALLAASAIGLGHWVGGPDEDTRITSAIVCALRNPGIALLVASANGMPAMATHMVLAHVVVTAILLLAYLFFRRRNAGAAANQRA